jgi:hypothetical protein
MKAPSPATRRQLYVLAALAVVLILAVVKWGANGSGATPSSPLPRAAGPAGPDEERPAASRPRPGAATE